VDFREVRSLALLAELGSIRRVAEAVHLSSPSVHKHLKTLEDELGTPLYERKGRSLKLTEAAETILPHLRQIVAEHDTAVDVLDEWKGIKRGLVRIGAGQIISSYWLPLILARFFARYPGVNASIHSGSAKTLVERLSDGALDVAFLPVPELHEEPRLLMNPFEVVCEVTNQEWALVSGRPTPRRKCPIADFASVPFVLYEKDLGINNVMNRYFAEVGFRPRVVVRCDYTEAIKAMVQRLPGISLLPLWGVQKEIQGGTLWLVRQCERPLSLKIVLARQKRRYVPPAVTAFTDVVAGYATQRAHVGASGQD
jgi:DNA-binding transcriptional LysR family regulator